jgi:diketogulonate reductase-like aldo/keto reductase
MTSYTKPAPKFDLSKPNPAYKLTSGVEMPVVAYGTFRSQPGEVGPAVIEAIKAGYRHFDLAHV